MNKRDTLIGLSIAAFLAVLVSPFASPFPDGLEKVAETHAFLEKGTSFWKGAVIPDYLLPGLKNERLATGMAGVVGTLLVFLLSLGLSVFLKKRTGAESGKQS